MVLMAEVPPFCDRACEELKGIELKTPASRELFDYLRQMNEQGKKCTLSGLLIRIQDAYYREQLVAVMASLDETVERKQILEDCIDKIKQGRATGRLVELRRLILAAENGGDEAKVEQAQKILRNAIIGLIITVGVVAIFQIFTALVRNTLT